jgi:GPI-anchor transamidase subunit S
VLYNPPPDVSSHTHMNSSQLESIMLTFKHQLLLLLGVPELPQGIVSSELTTPSSNWQLDALLRRRALENVQDSAETLQSIVKLVDQIKNMPVKEDVRGDIRDALTAYDMVVNIIASKMASLLIYSPDIRSGVEVRSISIAAFKSGINAFFSCFFQPRNVGFTVFPS